MTPDGRVNGGLNLSRAIGWVAAQLEGTVSFHVLGDHAYKRVESLSLSEQMISPQPDVKVLKEKNCLQYSKEKKILQYSKEKIVYNIPKPLQLQIALVEHGF